MSLSFIKLDINIMNDSKIKLIGKMPDGAKLFKLWIGILCLGMKSGRPGVLEIGDGLPFNDETLSIELDIELPVVRLGLDTFKKFKMIEIFDTGEIYLTNFEKHQQLGRIEHNNKMNRERVAKHRQKAKNVMITAPLPNGNVTPADLDSDSDLDLDSDKDIVITAKQQAKKDKEKELGKKAKVCFDYYFQKHVKEREFAPTVAGGRDMKIFKDILKADYTVGAVQEVIDFFFEYKKRSNFSTRALYNSFDTLYGVLLDKAEGRR